MTSVLTAGTGPDRDTVQVNATAHTWRQTAGSPVAHAQLTLTRDLQKQARTEHVHVLETLFNVF